MWKRRLASALIAFALLSLVVTAFAPDTVVAETTIATRAGETAEPVNGVRTFTLPFAAGHLALHWTGVPDANVTVAFSKDGTNFGAPMNAGRDEIGEQRANGETYGDVLLADSAVAARVTTDKPVGRLALLALADGAHQTRYRHVRGSRANAAVAQPRIVSRAGWGADESYRYNASGAETWPPAFYPVQKLVVHHTATQNNDPDPPATVRSIYYYHAITQGWGDIGYNFLIDEAGTIYKGRDSHTGGASDPPTADTITAENASGYGVTGAHAYNFNSGTVGVALLGTLTNQDATPAAKSALEDLLAWKADAHHIDPQGSSTYVNPVNGTSKYLPNIFGHRDVEATECPGGTFYATLPDVRAAVAARIAASSTTTTTTPTSTTTSTTSTSTSTTSSTTSTSTTTRPTTTTSTPKHRKK